jgi:hypothetical protein
MILKLNSLNSEVYVYPIGFIVAIGLSLPSIYFSYLLHSIPPDKTIKFHAVGTLIVSMMISSIPGLFRILRDLGLRHFYSFTYITWPIALFVVLPIISREANLLRVSIQSSDISQSNNNSLHNSRKALIGPILGLFFLFVPSLMAIPSSRYQNYSFLGAILRIDLALEEGPLGSFGPTLRILVSEQMMITAPLSGILFLFIIQVSKYCAGQAERVQSIFLGVVGTLLPYFVMQLTNGWPFIYEPYMLLPIPILFIFGVAILVLIKSETPIEHIWREES